jgi:hypothetical protein
MPITPADYRFGPNARKSARRYGHDVHRRRDVAVARCNCLRGAERCGAFHDSRDSAIDLLGAG